MSRRPLLSAGAAGLTAALLALAGGGPPVGAAPPERASVAAEHRAPASFVDVSRHSPGILHDIRYATRHNFVGTWIDGYAEARCLLTIKAASRLAKVQRDVRAQGYALKVYDCYRPQRAVNHFIRWADGSSQTMKREFYPRIAKSTLFRDGYIARRSGHSRGSTVDLTLVKIPAPPKTSWRPEDGLQPCTWPRWKRFPDTSIDMGTGYDCFDTRAHTADPRLTTRQRANRQRLVTAMERQGFRNYAKEWWHFTLTDETYPTTYFDFPVSRASLTR